MRLLVADTHPPVPLEPSPGKRLRDPEVEKFFLSILQSDLAAEEKYQVFVKFFELDASLSREIASRARELAVDVDSTKLQEMLATTAEQVGVWKPQQILQETEDSLRAAVRWLQVSQHPDGGWGVQPVSMVWATVHGVLALHMAESQGVARGPGPQCIYEGPRLADGPQGRLVGGGHPAGRSTEYLRAIHDHPLPARDGTDSGP